MSTLSADKHQLQDTIKKQEDRINDLTSSVEKLNIDLTSAN